MRKLKNIEEVGEAVAGLKNVRIAARHEMAHRDAACLAIAEQHAPRIAAYRQQEEEQIERIIEWMRDHKAEFNGPPRSMAFADGIVGYRLGQPHLKPLAKWTWKKVLTALQVAKEARFIREKPEVDRDALLAAAEEIGKEIMRDEYGLRVEQLDEPYIEITEKG